MIDPDPQAHRSGFNPRRNALMRLDGASAGPYGGLGLDGPRLRLRDYLFLRPYGRQLLTPAAAAWIGSAWVLILLMASLEGFVWGMIGLSLVPAETAWLGPPIGLFLFALLFAVVWVVDASLITSEKPRLSGQALRESGPLLRWLLGLLVRVGIVAISLYVTAPFIEKLIRADDIAAWHQAQVERYFDQRAETLREQVDERIAQLETGFQARIAGLEQQIGRIDEAIATERQRRERIRAEYQPEIEVLTRDLAEARQRVGDEVFGRDGRPAGYGPEARRWNARAELLAETLESKRNELEERVAPIDARIGALQQQLSEINAGLAELRIEEQALRERIRAEIEAEQPPPAPPELTFAARSKALTALRESSGEQGVPHFETVEGFAQAALGVLFFALIALKLFEPPAVQAYYSESVQSQYRKYLAGGLVDIPGFAHHDDPARRLSPAEFARRWEQWERSPDAFLAAYRDELDAKASLDRLDADREHERELLSRRRESIDHQLALEHRQRESELEVREQELQLRLGQFKERLDSETRRQRMRDEWAVEQEHQEQLEANLEAQRARREQRIDALQQRLEQHRSARAACRDQQLNLTRTLAENREAISATAQTLRSVEARINAQQPALRTLRSDLEEAERQRAAKGVSGWLSAPARRSRRLRRGIRRIERLLAPEYRLLDASRGRLTVLETEHEQLRRSLEEQRAAEDELQRRCDDERSALERLLLEPPPQLRFDAASPTTASANGDSRESPATAITSV
ncbi:MAG: DUF4407 domain-containing protein [Gammaproteobacteria bacterium]|jgi:hypothetical protein|nr:DUF4407 domain-containing protein [Gammaproteobacteria bacterium]